MTQESDSNKRTAAHVANYIIFLAEKNKIDNLTPLKLIKLCYISYAWYLSLKNKQLLVKGLKRGSMVLFSQLFMLNSKILGEIL